MTLEQFEGMERARIAKFRVAFERREGGMLKSDYLPEDDWLSSEIEAWTIANRLGVVGNGEFVNIYVVDSHLSPVPTYQERIIKPYPQISKGHREEAQ